MTINEIEARIKQIDEELADFRELKTIITVDTDREVDYLLELFPNYLRALRNERELLVERIIEAQ